MSDTVVAKRVDRLEELVKQIAYEHTKTEMELRSLSREMKEFKEEMRAYREDTQAFKNEMRAYRDDTQAFKDEMRLYRDDTQAFKDEMRLYRDDTQAFKDEMRAYRDDTQAFKDEMRFYRADTQVFKQEMKEFKEEMKASKKENDRRWGDLVNKLGTLVEDIVAPSLPRIVREDFGFLEIDRFIINARVRDKKQGARAEFDVLILSGDTLFVNETKSKPKIEYVDGFMKKLEQLPMFFPEYANKTIVPLFSSLYIPEDVLTYLTRQKIYALAMGEDVMEVLNMEEIT